MLAVRAIVLCDLGISQPPHYIDGCTTVQTVALNWPIFKQKKGRATICLGLNSCSMGSSQPPSRDTVPLKINLPPQKTVDWQKFHFLKISTQTVRSEPLAAALLVPSLANKKNGLFRSRLQH
jgi:hypothetical protein